MTENTILKEALNEIEYFEILDKVASYSQSELGKTLILNSLPFTEKSLIDDHLNKIDELIQIYTEDDDFSLAGLENVEEFLHKSKIENSALNTNEILNIYEFLQISRRVSNYFKSREEKYPLLNKTSQNLHSNRILEKHITDIINENGEVKDNASTDLQKIRREIFEKSNSLRTKIQKILKKTIEDDIAQEDFVSIREGRFVIPLKTSNKRAIGGIIHGISNTGATVFIEPPEIVNMNNDLSILQNQEQREIHRLLKLLTSEIASESNQLINSLSVLAHFDEIIAKTKYALAYDSQKPIINNDNYIELNNVRHPLLTHKLSKEKVIPLSISFENGVFGHLISGPNAGGKTVALKTIGLTIAMANTGLYTFGQCNTDIRRIFSSIGDHQSIENDLSTFSSQLAQLKTIIDNADSQSLVLIDEICSGTDPLEGSALAAGILDALCDYKIFFVTTTHQSSLKTYALNKKEISNASLEFDQDKLIPTYQFISGLPGNSYAFNLAKSIGINKTVIERASSYLGDRHQELEESINQLNQYRNEAQKIKLEAEKLKIEHEKTKQEFDYKLNDIRKNKAKILDRARNRAEKIVDDANKVVENTIREIQEAKKLPGEIKKEFNQQREQIKSKIKKEESKSGHKISEDQNLKLGDNVLMEDGSSVGIIIEINESKKNALVEINGLKFKIKLNQLKKVEQNNEQPKSENITNHSTYSEHISFDAKSRIDVRGKRAEEAIVLVDELISNAITSSVEILTIVHGKGTGALREAIHDFLSTHHLVKDYYEGKIQEGGAGITNIKI